MVPSVESASSGIQATVYIIENQILSAPDLRKRFSAYHRKLFSIDLALVAHNIRTGYLLDVAAPENAPMVFSGLIGSLRENPPTKNLFRDILHLFEPSSEQSFFVNTRLLPDHLGAILGSVPSTINSHLPPVFIHLVAPIESLHTIPHDLRALLDLLHALISKPQPLPPTISLPTDVGIETIVPLAAILLDYPVAYIPLPSKPHTLSGSLLDFYECILLSGSGNNDIFTSGHTIMKLSCPVGIDSCQPDILAPRLEAMFAERLRLTENVGLRCNVIHSSKVVDNVTF